MQIFKCHHLLLALTWLHEKKTHTKINNESQGDITKNIMILQNIELFKCYIDRYLPVLSTTTFALLNSTLGGENFYLNVQILKKRF